MTTPMDYREFAQDCMRWAETAKDASQRDTLIGIGRMWLRTAELMDEGHILLTNDPAAIFQELRAKLD